MVRSELSAERVDVKPVRCGLLWVSVMLVVEVEVEEKVRMRVSRMVVS